MTATVTPTKSGSRPARKAKAAEVETGDQRPIDLALMRQLLRLSLNAAQLKVARNPSIITCHHPEVADGDVDNFCGRCGALVVPFGAALKALALKHYGVAFALQQTLRGEAIALEQSAAGTK